MLHRLEELPKVRLPEGADIINLNGDTPTLWNWCIMDGKDKEESKPIERAQDGFEVGAVGVEAGEITVDWADYE